MSVGPLARYVIEAIVDEPEQVRVEVEGRGHMINVRVELPSHQRGAVIGGGGRTIRALETLLAVADPEGRAVEIDVCDPS